MVENCRIKAEMNLEKGNIMDCGDLNVRKEII